MYKPATLITPFLGRVDLTEISDSELFEEYRFNGDRDLLGFTDAASAPKYGDRTDAYATLIHDEIKRRAFDPAFKTAMKSNRYLNEADAQEGALFVVKELQVLPNALKHVELFAYNPDPKKRMTIAKFARKRVLQRDAVSAVDRGNVINARGVKNAPSAYQRQIIAADPTGITFENAAPLNARSRFVVEEIDAAVDAEAAERQLARAEKALDAADEWLARAQAAQAHRAAVEAVQAAETEEATAIRQFTEKVNGTVEKKHATALLHSTLITRGANAYLDDLAAAERQSRGTFTETETIESLSVLIGAEEQRLTPERKAVEAADAEEADARLALDDANEALDAVIAEKPAGSPSKQYQAALAAAKKVVQAAGSKVNDAMEVSAKASLAFDREASNLRSFTARLAVLELVDELPAAEAAVAHDERVTEYATAVALDARKRAAADNPLVYRDQTVEEKAANTAEREAKSNLARSVEAVRILRTRIETNTTAIERERQYATEEAAAISRISGNVERGGGADRVNAHRGGNVRTLGKEHIGKVMGVGRDTAGAYVAAAKGALYTDFQLMNVLRRGADGARTPDVNINVISRGCFLLIEQENTAAEGLTVAHIDAIDDGWFYARVADYLVSSEDAELLRKEVISLIENGPASALGTDVHAVLTSDDSCGTEATRDDIEGIETVWFKTQLAWARDLVPADLLSGIRADVVAQVEREYPTDEAVAA